MTARQCVTKTTTIDGHTVEFKFVKRQAPRYFYPTRGRPYLSPTWREYEAKPRVYVSTRGESLLDNLLDRTSRPYNVWRPFIKKAIVAFGFNNARLTWSQKAGCSMCPCSPGFIWSLASGVAFDGDDACTTHYDAWVTIEGVPVVNDDEAHAARALARLTSIAADPTLDVEALVNTRL